MPETKSTMIVFIQESWFIAPLNGVPVDFGGDPGPPGTTLMLKSALIQGLGTNLPFAFLFAAHSSAIDTILKYGTKKQIDIVSIDAVRNVVNNSGLFDRLFFTA